jgi:hypothetical protein
LTTNKAHRWLLPVLVLLLAAIGPPAAQAMTLVEHNAEPLGLPPSVGSPPEFGRCIKVSGGQYENAACTKSSASAKHYEWYPAFGGSQPLEKTGFTTAIKEGTLSTLETVGGLPVVCHGETSGGKYTGNKTVGGVVVTFTGCKSFELTCNSPGAASGTIVTNTLEGILGVEEPATEPSEDLIGEELHPASGTVVTSFSCSSFPVTVSGALIGQAVSNQMKLSDWVKFKAVSGKQQPEAFFGGTTAVLSMSFEEKPPEQAGETLTTNQANEEKIEISSIA